MKSKNILTASILGIATGFTIILMLYLKMLFGLSGIVIITLELLILVSTMIGTVKFLLKKNNSLRYQESQIIAFTVYLTAVLVLFIQRYIQGWFANKSTPAILLGIIAIIGLGWGISHIIGINNYKLENKE